MTAYVIPGRQHAIMSCRFLLFIHTQKHRKIITIITFIMNAWVRRLIVI